MPTTTRGRGKWHNTLFMNAANEIFQHDLGNIKLGDDAIAQRTNDSDIARRTSHHGLGLQANGQWLAQSLINCHPGGFINNNALTAHIYQCIRGPQINCNIQ